MTKDEKIFLKKAIASGKVMRSLIHPGDSKYKSEGGVFSKFIKNRKFDLGWAQLHKEQVEKENELRMYERVEWISFKGLWVLVILAFGLILVNLFKN